MNRIEGENYVFYKKKVDKKTTYTIDVCCKKQRTIIGKITWVAKQYVLELLETKLDEKKLSELLNVIKNLNNKEFE